LGIGGNGLGFGGFDGNDTTLTGGVDNTDGSKNLALAVITSNDDTDDTGDTQLNASRVGLLKGLRWPVPPIPNPLPANLNPHVRAGRWYDVKDVTPNIYGGQPNAVDFQLVPKANTPNHWLATVYVNGVLTQDHVDVTLPPTVFFGFTEGTKDIPERSAVSDVHINVGTLSAPTVTAAPNPVNFGPIGIGQATSQDVTITNNSSLPVSLAQGAISSGYSLSGLPATLLGNASATVHVGWTPAGAGQANGTAAINVTGADNTPGPPTSIALTGTGVTGPTPTPGLSYNAVPPTRILDTRPVDGIGPNGIKAVKVTGGVVPENAGAVIMNVTVDQPTADGFITLYPDGAPRPTASNLNFKAGQSIANLVTAKVGTGGKVDIYNFSGTTQVIFDVVGYFVVPGSGGTSTQADPGGQFAPLSPARILDTRSGNGAAMAPLGSGESLDLQVTGRGNVPATGVAAVVINLTGTNTTAAGYLTAWPTGGPRQTTSNLNFVADQSVPNLSVVPVGVGGKISIFNFAGDTDVVADVVGYYTAPGVSVVGGGLFHAMSPVRFLDTRPEAANLTLKDGGAVTTQISGATQAGIPAAGVVGVVANVTATNTTVPGFLTVYPAGGALPDTSSLNFVANQSVPNLAMSKLSSDGKVAVYNFSPGGTTDVIVDVVGFYGTS
jgi:hypothetical protein